MKGIVSSEFPRFSPVQPVIPNAVSSNRRSRKGRWTARERLQEAGAIAAAVAGGDTAGPALPGTAAAEPPTGSGGDAGGVPLPAAVAGAEAEVGAAEVGAEA